MEGIRLKLGERKWKNDQLYYCSFCFDFNQINKFQTLGLWGMNIGFDFSWICGWKKSQLSIKTEPKMTLKNDHFWFSFNRMQQLAVHNFGNSSIGLNRKFRF